MSALYNITGAGAELAASCNAHRAVRTAAVIDNRMVDNDAAVGCYCYTASAGHFYGVGLIEQLGLMESGGVLRVSCMHYNIQADLADFFAVLDQIVKV